LESQTGWRIYVFLPLLAKKLWSPNSPDGGHFPLVLTFTTDEHGNNFYAIGMREQLKEIHQVVRCPPFSDMVRAEDVVDSGVPKNNVAPVLNHFVSRNDFVKVSVKVKVKKLRKMKYDKDEPDFKVVMKLQKEPLQTIS
jgi:hypothetical protein